VRNYRRGARGNSSIERWTVNAYVPGGYRGLTDRARSLGGRTRQLGKVDMDLRHVCAAHGDRDRVPTGVTRFGLDGRVIVGYGMVVPINSRRVTMVVSGRPMVMLGMVVPDVFVHVERRGHGRRYDQATREHGCDESAHEDSLLRALPCVRNWRVARAASRPQPSVFQ
jgi:hypothetical protein